MMRELSGRQVLLSVLLIVIGGCATPVKEQEHTGFISDYSTLHRVADNAYRYTSPNVKNYSSFLVDGPAMLFERDTVDEERQFTDEELDELAAYFRDRLRKALTDNGGYTVVECPGPGIATIRIGITALDRTVGALNVTLYTKVTGAGLGGAAMEGEMIDSISHEQLAAAVQWGSGSRVLRAGFTKLGDAKLQINRWTDNLRDRIDLAHGRTGRSSDTADQQR